MFLVNLLHLKKRIGKMEVSMDKLSLWPRSSYWTFLRCFQKCQAVAEEAVGSRKQVRYTSSEEQGEEDPKLTETQELTETQGHCLFAPVITCWNTFLQLPCPILVTLLLPDPGTAYLMWTKWWILKISGSTSTPLLMMAGSLLRHSLISFKPP